MSDEKTGELTLSDIKAFEDDLDKFMAAARMSETVTAAVKRFIDSHEDMRTRVQNRAVMLLDKAVESKHPDDLMRACRDDVAEYVADLFCESVDWAFVTERYLREHIERIKAELGSDYVPKPTGDEWKDER